MAVPKSVSRRTFPEQVRTGPIKLAIRPGISGGGCLQELRLRTANGRLARTGLSDSELRPIGRGTTGRAYLPTRGGPMQAGVK